MYKVVWNVQDRSTVYNRSHEFINDKNDEERVKLNICDRWWMKNNFILILLSTKSINFPTAESWKLSVNKNYK